MWVRSWTAHVARSWRRVTELKSGCVPRSARSTAERSQERTVSRFCRRNSANRSSSDSIDQSPYFVNCAKRSNGSKALASPCSRMTRARATQFASSLYTRWPTTTIGLHVSGPSSIACHSALIPRSSPSSTPGVRSRRSKVSVRSNAMIGAHHDGCRHRLRLLIRLSEIQRPGHVHVAVIEVLARHPPDEGVVARAGAGVDGPRRRDHGLLVVHPDVARLLRRAHEVAHSLAVRHIEVQVHLHAPIVRVRRHRVPDASRLQLRHPHLQLARLQHVLHEQLSDGTVI